MRPHRFDPISGSLGLVAVTAGILVTVDAVRSIDAGWWLAVGALVIGLGLVPWTRPQTPVDEGQPGNDAPPADVGYS